MEQSAARVLVVDDDNETCTLIQDILNKDSYEVWTSSNGEHALALLERERFDVVLSDIKMPGISGIDLLLHVRRKNLDTEVILMTAYASVQSAVEALRGEAFDYLTKPFALKELHQVIHQALRTRRVPFQRRAVMHYKDLSVDRKARRAWIRERQVHLTRLEFEVLAYLFANMNDTVSHQELLEQVWGCDAAHDRSHDTIKSCISRLRKKLGDDSQNTRYIHNVWGVGYKLGD